MKLLKLEHQWKQLYTHPCIAYKDNDEDSVVQWLVKEIVRKDFFVCLFHS